jgi:hypothetical protein
MHNSPVLPSPSSAAAHASGGIFSSPYKVVVRRASMTLSGNVLRYAAGGMHCRKHPPELSLPERCT